MLRRSEKYKYRIALFKEDLPKPKKNEIIILPEDNRLLENPPVLASEYKPEWFQNLPKGKNSLRRCAGTYDYMGFGFIIRAWADFTIRPDVSGKNLEARCSQIPEGQRPFIVDWFSYEATGECPFTKNRLVPESSYPKLVSPWRYITPKNVSLMALPVWHEQNPNYSIVPGIVHTDYYHQIHVVLNVYTDKEFVIPEGTALQHMIPIRRDCNTEKIIFGNSSMFRFTANAGTTKKNGITIDKENLAISQNYRRNQREKDAI